MSILNLINKNANLRKIFGKRELVIIQKQLLGVQLKNSEKTRLSRDIKKKLEAIKEIAKFGSEFELKKGAEIKKRVGEAKEIILQNRLSSFIKRIMLFGSAAENRLTLSSDIDIAVEFINVTKEDANRFRREVMGNVDEKVDVQVYNFLPNKIKKEILNKRKVLYEQTH